MEKLTEKDVRLIFRDCELYHGRCITWSKGEYKSQNPEHVCVFNAAVFNTKSENIWNGDLDITLDSKKLQTVSSLLNEQLFVLRESDTFLRTEYTLEELNKKAVWKTNVA